MTVGTREKCSVDDYNVVWHTPSRDSSGSMPLGNGDVALNVWVEEGGDLLFYIAKPANPSGRNWCCATARFISPLVRG
ncbi:MAG: DUF5703 domain-containing protein [bacterium]|jgi:hypothetical protein